MVYEPGSLSKVTFELALNTLAIEVDLVMIKPSSPLVEHPDQSIEAPKYSNTLLLNVVPLAVNESLMLTSPLKVFVPVSVTGPEKSDAPVCVTPAAIVVPKESHVPVTAREVVWVKSALVVRFPLTVNATTVVFPDVVMLPVTDMDVVCVRVALETRLPPIVTVSTIALALKVALVVTLSEPV